MTIAALTIPAVLIADAAQKAWHRRRSSLDQTGAPA
jgi:hypothetical protein